jgi:hypothetical protein
MTEPKPPARPNAPLAPGEDADPAQPHEIENPGDPGPNVLGPRKTDDPRTDPRMPEVPVAPGA